VPIPPAPPLIAPVAPEVTRASYSPPQTIFQVTPIAPSNLPPGKESVVHVVVDIDETGKVTRVTHTGLTATNFALVAVATQAANKWRFRPAIQDGRPVASKMNLTFKFGVK
jgi:TonB family protein